MTYKEFKQIEKIDFVPILRKLYGLDNYSVEMVDRGYEICEGHNAVYYCKKENDNTKILRLSLNERGLDELLAETEYIRYLYENGAGVSNVITSLNGKFIEEIVSEMKLIIDR